MRPIKWIRNEWTYYSISHYCEGRRPLKWNFMKSLVVTLFNQWKCRRVGHDWKDISSAGPDSGDVSGYCRRCGYSYHTQLY